MNRFDHAMCWLQGHTSRYEAADALDVPSSDTELYEACDERALCELGEDLFFEVREAHEHAMQLLKQKRDREDAAACVRAAALAKNIEAMLNEFCAEVNMMEIDPHWTGAGRACSILFAAVDAFKDAFEDPRIVIRGNFTWKVE